ncbi:MAG: hypothetical protein ACRD5B_10290 [Nitrososphaeraceae archaeon]
MQVELEIVKIRARGSNRFTGLHFVIWRLASPDTIRDIIELARIKSQLFQQITDYNAS